MNCDLIYKSSGLAIILPMDRKTVRLDKFLANAGVLSRRGVKPLLKAGVVSVDGTQITEAGYRLDPAKSIVKVDHKIITPPRLVYFLLNKPKGYISTVSDTHARRTVVSLIPTQERIYPIGRLDKDTHGLLLLTNDGGLTHKLIHPRYHVPKTYRLKINGQPTPEQIQAFRQGVLLDDGITKPALVRVEKNLGSQTNLLVTIHEGRNRQIRRMCETVDMELIDLSRIVFGPIILKSIPLGECRELTPSEVGLLYKAVQR